MVDDRAAEEVIYAGERWSTDRPIDDVLGGIHGRAAHDRLRTGHGGKASRGNGKQRGAQGSIGTHEILHLVDQVPPE